MKTWLVAGLCVLISLAGSMAQAARYLFEYSGTVRSVSGTVTDGSLLNFSVSDTVFGSFVFDSGSASPPPGTLSVSYPDSIESFRFASFTATGTQPSHSYFLLDALSGRVNAYKQVGTGSIYDNYEFSVEAGVGNSPFTDVSFDVLPSLDLMDFPSDRRFFLQRVDISTTPVRFTEVTVVPQSLQVFALFTFTGFFSPIDNDPVVNRVRAGAAVPVKFSLHGDRGLNVLAEGFPASQPIACGSAATLAPVEETVSAGKSGLTYDASIDQYTYVWKTQPSWGNTCRRLVLVLTDESVHIATFQFD